MMDCFDKAMECMKNGEKEKALEYFKQAIEEGINIPEAKKWVAKLEKEGVGSEKEVEEESDSEDATEPEDDTPAPSFTKSGFKIEINVTPLAEKATKEYVGMKKKYGGKANSFMEGFE
jgi:hypothetical protein